MKDVTENEWSLCGEECSRAFFQSRNCAGWSDFPVSGSESEDPINQPAHYTAIPGVEPIDLAEHLMFNRGNVVKYVTRAGKKNPEKELEDLKKAQWYLNREIARLEKDS